MGLGRGEQAKEDLTEAAWPLVRVGRAHVPLWALGFYEPSRVFYASSPWSNPKMAKGLPQLVSGALFLFLGRVSLKTQESLTRANEVLPIQQVHMR